MTNLPTNWVTGQTLAATDVDAMNTATNANTAAVSTLQGRAMAAVTTSETTSLTTYTDLATTSDTVTVNIGSSGMALVILNAFMQNGAADGVSYMSFAMSGTNSQVASDSWAKGFLEPAGGGGVPETAIFPISGLAPGSTTFKMKYRVSTNTGTFSNRRIAVIPVP